MMSMIEVCQRDISGIGIECEIVCWSFPHVWKTEIRILTNMFMEYLIKNPTRLF